MLVFRSIRSVAACLLLALVFLSAHAHPNVHPTESWTAYQRTTTAIPDTANELRLALGDITRGHVRTRILDRNGRIIAGARLHEGEHLHFTHDGHAYALHLLHLKNFVLGNDRATFALSRRISRLLT